MKCFVKYFFVLFLFNYTALGFAQTSSISPLPADQAFQLTVHQSNHNEILLNYLIADGYYLYKERFKFELDNPKHTNIIKLEKPIFSQADNYYDANFEKNMVVFFKQATIRIPLSQASESFKLKIVSQGCSKQGICYPPITKWVYISAISPITSKTPAILAINKLNTFNKLPNRSDQQISANLNQNNLLNKIDQNKQHTGNIHSISLLSFRNIWLNSQYAEHILKSSHFVFVLGVFFLLGLALSLLPCSWPMLPIVSSILIGNREKMTRWRGFALSLSYVLGLAMVYTFLGIFAALAGHSLAAMLQNAWTLSIFGLLLFVFALSQMDCFTVQLPNAWQNKLNNRANQLKAGQWFSAFMMGALSALVVGACMTAPLFGILTFIAQTQQIMFGAIALFTLALGLGTPLILIGLGAGAILPRAGQWMNQIKYAFGLLLMISAWWVVTPIMPVVAANILLAIIVFLAASFLIDKAAESKWMHFLRASALLLIAYGFVLIIAATSGGTSHYKQPLKNLFIQPISSANTKTIDSSRFFENNFKHLTASLALLNQTVNQTIQTSQATSKMPSLVFFHAQWCSSCLEMKSDVFSDLNLQKQLSAMQLLDIDLTKDDDNSREIMHKLSLFGPPAIIFFDENGSELKTYRLIGPQTVETLSNTIQAILKNPTNI